MEIALSAGDVIADKYRVERVLGVGGMGVVIAATHLDLHDRVAIKFLLPEHASSDEAVLRFMREGRAAARIKGEHVARVHDVGRLPERGPYIVMEYLEGSNLRAVLTQGALPVGVAVEYVLQACEAIAEAHAAGIVHRDLKPSNLFVTFRADGSPCVKVLDFGISKMRAQASDAELEMTKTATVLGSPLYMSPEQMACARDVDARTDVWGLGTILYELCTGQRPFQALTMPELCARVLQGTPRRMGELQPDLPAGLEAVVLRCLEKTPQKRYRSIADLARALAPFSPDRGRLSVERVVGMAPAAERDSMTDIRVDPPPEAETTQSAAESSAVRDDSRPATRRASAAAVTAGLVLSAIVIFAATRSPDPPPAASADVAAAAPPVTNAAPVPEPAPPPPPSATEAASATLPASTAAPKPTASARPPRKGKPAAPRAAETAGPGLFNTQKW